MKSKAALKIDKTALKDAARGRAARAAVPSSVYRVQFSKDLTFRRATELVPYLKALGVDALYASPYFETPPGSPHGYNITDPNSLNPELGSREDYEKMCEVIRKYGMKHVLDVVPNHVGIAGRNKLWVDVLENGAASIYADFFDINWNPGKRELRDKVLIPILGGPYGSVLENGEIRLSLLEGMFRVSYWEHELPLDPKTYPVVMEYGIEELKQTLGEESPELLEYLSVVTAFRNLPGRTEKEKERVHERNREKEIAKSRLAALIESSDKVKGFLESRVEIFNGVQGRPLSFDLLDELLNQQVFRVAYWRVASEEINYRRFFDINELAAFRIEDDNAFEFHHQLVFNLISQGKVTGLRIDHPDGLYDPPGYFDKLQKRALSLILEEEIERSAEGNISLEEDEKKRLAAELADEDDFKEAKPLYVVVEKILEREELLPENWKVHGTVGYEYLNNLNGVFVDQGKEKDFSSLYEKFIGQSIDFEKLLYEKKKFFALIHMASEVNTLGDRLNTISERNRHYQDLTRSNLIVAIREVMACFTVYRTYISPQGGSVSSRDEGYIRQAVEKAKRRAPALPSAVYDFLRDVLLLRLEFARSEDDRALCLEFVLRFQQLTGPVMAKGLEDTSFYIFNRLLSLNEVGGSPTHFGSGVEDFHSQNERCARVWPGGLITASTHDTKRSEDVRMRLNVLSEMPEVWESCIERWSRLNEKHRTLLEGVFQPRRNTEYFIYQTLLGVWPDEADPEGKDEAVFQGRVWQYLEKALREAKTDTNWINPDLPYEEAVKKFLFGVLEESEENQFLKDFLEFQKKVSFYGKLNTLSALVLRLASPGVFDVYQGTELWNYRLVDPDNRGEVDFDARCRLLKEARDVFASQNGKRQEYSPEDGRLKLYLLWRGMNLRCERRELFEGEYVPLQVEGERAKHVVAFLRRAGQAVLLCAAGRFFSGIYPDAKREKSREAWGDTRILLPRNMEAAEVWTDIFSGEDSMARAEEKRTVFSAADLFQNLDAVLLTADLGREEGVK